jgi:hypothetical protein
VSVPAENIRPLDQGSEILLDLPVPQLSPPSPKQEKLRETPGVHARIEWRLDIRVPSGVVAYRNTFWWSG